MHNILVVGQPERPEMQPVRDWLSMRRDSAVAYSRRLDPFADEQWPDGPPDLVVVCQSWPDEFTVSEVSAALGRWPLAQWVCCFGSWCESDGRTRSIWPIGVRVPARAVRARLDRVWRIVLGQIARSLPLTASRDEAFEFDALIGKWR